MAWTEFTDETVGPFETKRTCFRCLQKIIPGVTLVQRRGLLDGERKTVTFHDDCVPLPDDPAHGEPAAAPVAESEADAEDAVTSPPVTTPLATTADEEAAAASQAAAAEADAAAAGTITPAQQQKLQHLAAIKAKSLEADVAYGEWQEATIVAKERKKVYEGHMGELRSIIRTGSAQSRLAFDDGDDEESPAARPAPPTAAEQPAWMSVPLSALKLPASLLERLAEGAIETLGQLKAFWDSGRMLQDLKGIGSEKAARVADAFESYGKEHPEVYGGATFTADDDDALAGPADLDDDGEGPDEGADEQTEEDDDPFADDLPDETTSDDAAA